MESMLNKEEIERAKICIVNIEDKMASIKTEIVNTDKPYKPYLLEKLKSIFYDVNCLINMCGGDE